MIWRRGFRASRRAAVAPAIPHPIIRTSVSANVSLPPVKDESQRSGFAQKVTCQHYSTASEATGWHTQRTNHQILGVMSSVPSGRFARGTVLIARHSPRLEFLCKAQRSTAATKQDLLGQVQYRFAVASGESRGSTSYQHSETHPTLPRIGTDLSQHCSVT